MFLFAQRLDAAIRASGKTANAIADEAGTSAETISKLRKGKHDNPELQLFIRVAQAVGTTVGALLGDSIAISAEDETELLRFRGWIDEKLATIDARREPNAILVPQIQAQPATRTARVAERPRQKINDPFDANGQLVLRAVGDSMNGAGILDDDTLYATAPASDDAAIGSIVACRIGDDLFVKRLVSEHRRLYLLSAHPRYRPIPVDPNSFAILGVVISRTGKIR